MESLTLDEILKLVNEAATQMELDNCKECSENYKQIAEYLEELKSYKGLEEQGLLVRLPCPIGTTVWDIYGMEIRKITVTSIEYNGNKEYVLWAGEDELLGTLNEAVFLTREEAEKKLEEIQNDKA